MSKLLGIFLFMVALYAGILAAVDPAAWGYNNTNLGQRIGLEGILCLGAGLLIISGGVDLSIGSVVGLCACVFCKLVLDEDYPVPIPVAAIIVVLLGAAIGFVNGFLVTFFRVQAFVVTLCGLFIYRGAARWVMNDQTPVIAALIRPIKEVTDSSFLMVPMYLWFLLILFALTTIFLHFTIHGRYFYAIGSNERAAAYAGINTTLYRILAYMLCSMFAAIYSLMHVAHYVSVEPPKVGEFLELYAIAGAVLGGCSLRGGEGSTLGILIGTTIMRLLPNLANMWSIRDTLYPTVIGGALLICVILDEILRRGSWREFLALFRRSG